MANLSELWQTAEYLLTEAKYKEAIATLEEIQSFSSQLRPEKLIELKKGLIEAYINSGQREKAIMLCHSLINTRRSDLKTWAEEKLAIIEPAEETREKHDLTSSDKLGSKINLKSVSDFKRFCLANLMLILKEFEQKRTNAIITIAVASICFIAIIYLIGKGFHLFHYIPKCSEVSFKQNNYVRYGSCYRITS